MTVPSGYTKSEIDERQVIEQQICQRAVQSKLQAQKAKQVSMELSAAVHVSTSEFSLDDSWRFKNTAIRKAYSYWPLMCRGLSKAPLLL